MRPVVYTTMAAIGSYVPASSPVAPSPDIETRLAWAGLADEIDALAWDNVKRAVGISVALLVFVYAPGWFGLVLAAPVYYAATFIPDVLLNADCDKARAVIDKELAAFAENLAILTGAGLSISLALPEAAAEVPGILGSCLAKAVNEIRLGTPRRSALTIAAARTPSKDFQRLAGLVVDAERFGTPVAAELTRMAAELREKRMAVLREEAQKLPVKMLFPLVFMILPAFILLTAGPIFVSMI